MAENLKEALMPGPQPVQTKQSPAPLTNKRSRAPKTIQDVLVVMGCGAGAVWCGMILLRLSASKRKSPSTSLVEESFLLCEALAGDVGSQTPFWLQMLGTVTSNVILHFTIAVKSLNKPVGMFDVATTLPITMALAYTTYANIYHGAYFFLVWWSATLVIGLLGFGSFTLFKRWKHRKEAELEEISSSEEEEEEERGEKEEKEEKAENEEKEEKREKEEKEDEAHKETVYRHARRRWLLSEQMAASLCVVLGLDGLLTVLIVILTIVTASLLSVYGLLPSYNCSALPWIRASSLSPTFFGTFCSLYVYKDFSRGRLLLNAPFMLLTLIQMPPVFGMLISQVLPGTFVYFIPLTGAEALGIGLILAISNTHSAKKTVRDFFERFRPRALLPTSCVRCLRKSSIVIACLPIVVVGSLSEYVERKVRFATVETQGVAWKYFWVPLDVKMLLVPTVVFCQFTGETMVRLYLGEGWWQSMYLTWAERTWHEYSQYVFNTSITFQQSVQTIWLQIISQFCVGG